MKVILNIYKKKYILYHIKILLYQKLSSKVKKYTINKPST